MMDDAQAPRTAMILAAGRGERMRPLTDSVPKPLLRIGAHPLIHYHIVALARAGIDRLVVNLAWLGGQIRDYLGDGSRYGVAITYSDESPQALETGGGIFRALRWLTPDPFAVINGDIFCNYPLQRLRLPAGSDAHLILVPNPPQHPGGDFSLHGDRAQPRISGGANHTFAGIAVYRASFFRDCVPGAFPLKPLLLRSMQAGLCSAELFNGRWEDVGTVDRLQRLNAEQV